MQLEAVIAYGLPLIKGGILHHLMRNGNIHSALAKNDLVQLSNFAKVYFALPLQLQALCVDNLRSRLLKIMTAGRRKGEHFLEWKKKLLNAVVL